MAVSNLDETLDATNCLVGAYFGAVQKCATGFTTGSSAAGYKLHSVTATFNAQLGNPGTFTVRLYDKSGNQPGSAISGATFSGSAPGTAGDHTYTCSGNGCNLSPNTDYFVAMSASATAGNNHYSWRTTRGDGETLNPSDNGWSIANNLWEGANLTTETTNRSGVMKLAASVVTGLGVSNKKATTATLGIGGYTGQWWYVADKSPYTSCHSAGSAGSVNLDHLTASTEYTFTAYDASGCNSADEIASETFTTLPPTLTVSGITDTTATLTFNHYGSSWYYKATSGPDTSCSSNAVTGSVNLTGLTAGNSYTYSAYSDSTCTTANKLATASAFTTSNVSVSNLGETLTDVKLHGGQEF